MDEQKLREICLALPQAFESFPFGDAISVFKTSANGKIFALGSLETTPLTISVKCDPEEGLALRAEFPAIIPGYHLNKKHWITIDSSAVPDRLIEQLIAGSHLLVKPRVPRSSVPPPADKAPLEDPPPADKPPADEP